MSMSPLKSLFPPPSATTIMAGLHTDTTTGAAARERYASKIKHYTARFIFPRGRLWPIVLETGGRMHPDSRAHLSELAKGSLGLGPDEKIPGHKVAEFNLHLRILLDTLAVTLARCVTDTLLNRQWERGVPVRKGNITLPLPSSPDEDGLGG